MNTVRTEKCSSRRIQTCIKTSISTNRVKFPFKVHVLSHNTRGHYVVHFGGINLMMAWLVL